MFEVSSILWFSVVMQCVAVALALRLIPETRQAIAWILLSSAFLLMATRRTMSLLREEGVFQNSWLHSASTEIVALIISILMVAGVYMIRRIFEQQRQDAVQVNKLSSVVEQSPVITIIMDADGKIEYVNPAYTRATGDSLSAMTGKIPEILTPGYTDENTSQQLWNALVSGDSWDGELRSYNHGDSRRWESVRLSPVISEDSKVRHYVASIEDITRQKTQHEELKHVALHDDLTCLPNRTLFLDRLGQAIRVAKDTNGSLAVMLLDLDNFKDVNDSLGHNMGDRVLSEIGGRLLQIMETGDTVARMGGDEFLVLLPSANEAKCIQVMERIANTIQEPLVLEDLPVELSASIGFCMYPDDGGSAELLLQHADIAMYEAKESHELYARYNESEDDDRLQRLELASELRSAIEGNQLQLHYQPQINFNTKQVDKVEVLVRWHHPDRGLLYPDAFISLAEKIGYISRITEWVLNEALKQLAEWKQSGISLGMSINISVNDLASLGLPELMDAKIKEYGIESSMVTLEITESVLMSYTQQSMDVLTELKAMGVNISIDDFGTGYSSLQHLKELPISELKIDKSFVINMLNNDDDAIIVRSTTDLAHNLGLTVVAEGIESQDIFDILDILGCNHGQGFHLGRPVTAETLTFGGLSDQLLSLQPELRLQPAT